MHLGISPFENKKELLPNTRDKHTQNSLIDVSEANKLTLIVVKYCRWRLFTIGFSPLGDSTQGKEGHNFWITTGIL